MIGSIAFVLIPLELMPEGPMLVAVVGAMFAGLISCFFGYVLFRLELTVTGLFWGLGLGGLIVLWRFDAPRGIDYFVICTATGLLVALASWLLYRLLFTLGTFAAFGLAVAGLLITYTSATRTTVWPWIVGAVAGIGPGVAAFLYMRQVFIFLSALFGAFVAILSAALVIGSPPGEITSGGPRWMIWVLVLGTIPLTAAGMYAQVWLARILRTSLAPTSKRDRRGKPLPPKKKILPRFTKL